MSSAGSPSGPCSVLQRRRKRGGAVVAIFASLAAAVVAAAPRPALAESVLPLIVDASRETTRYWWSAALDGAPAGELDEALFAAAERGHELLVAPDTAGGPLPISRIYRRPDLTVANALNLAQVLGHGAAMVGRLEHRETEPVAWLEEVSVTLHLAVELASGQGAEAATREEFVRQGVGSTEAEARQAAARLLAVDLQGWVQAVEQISAPGTVPASEMPTLAIATVSGSAAGYPALRRVVRESHPAIIDVVETWATEGWIAIAPVLDEGADATEIVARFARLPEADFDAFSLRAAGRVGSTVFVELDVTPTGDH